MFLFFGMLKFKQLINPKYIHFQLLKNKKGPKQCLGPPQ